VTAKNLIHKRQLWEKDHTKYGMITNVTDCSQITTVQSAAEFCAVWIRAARKGGLVPPVNYPNLPAGAPSSNASGEQVTWPIEVDQRIQ
jgi:hypothetical protein